MKQTEIAIIGAGPAGIAAAIQLSRYGLRPMVFESCEVGGLLKNANLVENYPGFPEGIAGAELVKIFREQLSNYSPSIINRHVTDFQYSSNKFQITTTQKEYAADVMILATGTKPNTFNDFQLPNQCLKNVFYEIAEINKCRNQDIIIVGAGDAAFDYALNLGKHNRIKILNRGKEIKSLPLLIERANANPDIEYFDDHQIKAVTHEKAGLGILCNSPAGEILFAADKLVGAIGRTPNNSLIENHTNEFIRDLIQSRVLYRIGDVNNGIFRQTSIAVADGVQAAMQIYRFITELNT